MIDDGLVPALCLLLTGCISVFQYISAPFMDSLSLLLS